MIMQVYQLDRGEKLHVSGTKKKLSDSHGRSCNQDLPNVLNLIQLYLIISAAPLKKQVKLKCDTRILGNKNGP